MRRRAALVLSVLVLLGACDQEPAPVDASMDAGSDAGRDSGGPDAAPAVCAPDCSTGETCCPGPGDEGVCYALRSDPEHCGNCQVDCLTTHRGDGCQASQCTCGSTTLGCRGTSDSYCCPPRAGISEHYCANLEQDATNCGLCGVTCDVRRANHCDGGRCVCGLGTRDQCDGTPESTCCVDPPDVGCVDTTTDRFHCGACNNLCQGVERCESSTCTQGTACDGGCGLGEVCCNGSCCDRRMCDGSACRMPPDAGLGDAGPSDAGPSDAGIDAGGADAGIDAG